MPDDIKITNGTSVANYHNFDNSNYTIAGYDFKLSKDNWNASTFTGIGLNYKNNPDLVIDLKGTYNYNDNLNSNIRLRTKLGDNNTVQLRISPISTSFKLGKNTKLYTNLNDCITYKSNTGKVKNQINFFGGISQKVGENVTVWAEGEVDDIYRSPADRANLGFNAGVNITF